MRFSRFFALCALLGFLPPAARALTVPTFDPGNNAPMPAALVQLYTDLAAIAPDATVTDAQHQAIVADLRALAAGIFTPDPAAVDQLATDLSTAATLDLFSDNVVQSLADDFIGDPDTPVSWLEDIQDDLASLLDPPPPDSYETFYPTTGLPVETSVAPLGTFFPPAVNNGSLDRFTVRLDTQGVPPGLLQRYSGRARFTSHRGLGIFPLPTLTLDTAGLPPGSPYTASITRESDGASVVLGKFRVHNGYVLLSSPISVARIALSVTTLPAAEIASSSHVVFGFGMKKTLPAGYDAADVATLTVTDAQGVVRLSGNIAGGQRTSELKALRFHLSGAPVVSGLSAVANVAARHQATSGQTTDRFRFMAKHLPPSTQVTLLADGVVVDRYTTTAHGRLFIIEGFEPQRSNRAGESPPFNGLRPGTDLSGTKIFALTDAQGNTLLTGGLAD